VIFEEIVRACLLVGLGGDGVIMQHREILLGEGKSSGLFGSLSSELAAVVNDSGDWGES
jgi:hypothetical protein